MNGTVNVTIFYQDDLSGSEEKVVVPFPEEQWYSPYLKCVAEKALRGWLTEQLGDDGSGNVDDCMETHKVTNAILLCPETLVVTGTYTEIVEVRWSMLCTINDVDMARTVALCKSAD